MLSMLLALLLAQSSTELDAALDRVAAVKPGDAAAYESEREKVLAFGKDAIPALAERGAPDRWTEAGWVRAMAAEACRVRLADPELAADIDRLEGLDPAHYRQFRTGEPMVLRTFVRRGAGAVPLLIERWRWTFDKRAYSAGEAGEKERATLRNGILSLPGQIPDPRARHFLAETLASADLRDAWRGDAAVSLGMVAGPAALPKLAAILDEAGSSALREACARALGRVADPAALEAIRARLHSEKDIQVRRSYLAGLGLLGSSWGWESRGKEAAATAEAVRAGCAEALVEAIRRYPAESETIGRSLAMTKWAASLKAVESIAADSGAALDVRKAAEAILPSLRLALTRGR
jgi:hypothetical protein